MTQDTEWLTEVSEVVGIERLKKICTLLVLVCQAGYGDVGVGIRNHQVKRIDHKITDEKLD